ncbi:hypothetical protein SALBM135S_06052 [Streptomyces alboniger]
MPRQRRRPVHRHARCRAVAGGRVVVAPAPRVRCTPVPRVPRPQAIFGAARIPMYTHAVPSARVEKTTGIQSAL